MADENRPPAYSVPLLPANEILDVINNGLMFPLKKKDIIPGSAEKIREVYLLFLEQFHPNVSFNAQPRFKDLGDNLVEDMEASLVVINNFQELRTVLARMNYHNVTPMDIFFPTFERTQPIFSHLINLWRFTSSREETRVSMREKFNALSKRKVAIMAEAPTLQRKLNDVATKTVEAQEKLESLCEQQNAVRREIKDEITNKETNQHKAAEKKALYAKLGQEIKVLKETLEELKKQNAMLEEKVVNSPEQLEDIVASRKQAIAGLKVEIANAKKRFSDYAEHARNYSLWQSRVLALFNHAKDIKEQMTVVLKTKNEDLGSIESKKQALRENIADAEANYESLVVSLKKLQEKDGSLRHQHDVRKNCLVTQLKEARMSRKNIKKKVTQIEIAQNSALEEYDQLIVRMKQSKADFKAAEKNAETYRETVAALDIYHKRLDTYITQMEQIINRLAKPSEFGAKFLELVRSILSESSD